MKNKIFTEKQVDLSAFLAGPIPAGLLIYKNYRALGKEKQAYIALASSLIFTILFFYIIFQLPEHIIDETPSFVFSALYGILVFIFFRKFLAKDVNEALELGAEKGSNWSVAGLTIVGLLINLAIIFGLAFYQPFYEGQLLEVNGNELYYDENVSEEDINKLVRAFEDDFFADAFGNTARLQIINGKYYITMVVDETLWNDQEIINSYTSLKWILEIEYNKPTHLKFESINLTGKSIYKEL